MRRIQYQKRIDDGWLRTFFPFLALMFIGIFWNAAALHVALTLIFSAGALYLLPRMTRRPNPPSPWVQRATYIIFLILISMQVTLIFRTHGHTHSWLHGM